MVYYPVPVHRFSLYQESHSAASCPVAERAAKEVLSLPIWPELEVEEIQERMANAWAIA
jgi:dTDP-4-amino-4,6-dideoxygalactose transaminase